jgi:hypothetical protein
MGFLNNCHIKEAIKQQNSPRFSDKPQVPPSKEFGPNPKDPPGSCYFEKNVQEPFGLNGPNFRKTNQQSSSVSSTLLELETFI